MSSNSKQNSSKPEDEYDIAVIERRVIWSGVKPCKFLRCCTPQIRFGQIQDPHSLVVQQSANSRFEISIINSKQQISRINFQKALPPNKEKNYDSMSDIILSSSNKCWLVVIYNQMYSIRLWDVKTGQQKAKLDGHSYAVNSICYSPDGTTLASGSADSSIRLWDVKTGQQKAKLDGHSSMVNSICYSPDGTTLASGSADSSIRLWDVKTGQQQAKLNGHSSTVNSIYYSSDGTTLASGSDDNHIRLWDVKTGQQILSSDNCYQDIVAQFSSQNFNNNLIQESVNSPVNYLVISNQLEFRSQGAIYQSVWHRLENIIQTKRKLHFNEPNWIINTMKIDQYLQSFNTYIYFNLQQLLTRVHSPRNSQVFLNWKGTPATAIQGNSENSSNMARRDMKPRELETMNEKKDDLLIFCSDPIADSGLQLSSLQRSLLYIISSAIYASGTNTNSRTIYQNHRLITQISMTHQGVSLYNYKLIKNIQCSSQRTPLGSRVRHPLNHPALLTPGVLIQTTI
ncbi:unnamed protein product [Paramecium octaurelia]|uniref:EML-like second beta-propeller domain-containing protein n=1 Tax=Paramecium octaurelia TaxID=43137 RepID=A0A8S1YNZ7_PAROT|nr:unnamed protein product [Paramecium octaurelia]